MNSKPRPKGRPLKIRDNHWNEKWYQQLRQQASFVLQRQWSKLVDRDDLIADAWIQSARRQDPEGDLQYKGRIRIFMIKYLTSRKARQESDQVERQETADPWADNKVEASDEVTFLLSKLSKRDQSLVRMRYWDGMANAEIALVLDCSGESVRLWLKAAMATMAEDNHPS